MFENRVKVKLLNDLHDLCSGHILLGWPDNENKMGAACCTYGGEKCIGVLVGKPEWRRHLWIPKRTMGYNIKTDLKEIRCEGVDWIDLALERNVWLDYVNAVMNFRVPEKKNAAKLVTSWALGSIERMGELRKKSEDDISCFLFWFFCCCFHFLLYSWFVILFRNDAKRKQ